MANLIKANNMSSFKSLELDSNTETRFGIYSPEVHQKIDELGLLVDNNPKKAVTLGKKLCMEHPDVPAFFFLLFQAYDRTENDVQANKVAKEMYQKFPDYHLAKCVYAIICLRGHGADSTRDIFHSFNLDELYPEKTVFHAVDVLAFYMVIGFYHINNDEIELAKKYLAAMKEIHEENCFFEELDMALFFVEKIEDMNKFMDEHELNACERSEEHDCCFEPRDDVMPEKKKKTAKKNKQLEDMPF